MSKWTTYLIFLLLGCSNHKKENPLATEMNSFLISGKYDVDVWECIEKNKPSKSIDAELTLTNKLGLIEFNGINTFHDLDSIKISLNDSTVLRNYSVNHFIDTISVTADKSGINKDFFGYAFGKNDLDSGMKIFLNDLDYLSIEDNSGTVALFVIGTTKKDEIIIKRIERVVSSGQKLMDVNKVFILKTKKLF